jgi:CDP-diacylglycerol--glycerol-3-phosphate 3-phosphatidyltransferase
MLDGFLARALGVQGPLGARLDSAADFVLVAVLLWRLLPLIAPPVWLLAWAAGITVLRLSAAAVAVFRYGVLAFLHTRANKITGLLLFLYPLAFYVSLVRSAAVLLCLFATVSSAEELVINLTSREWEPDRKGLFSSPE